MIFKIVSHLIHVVQFFLFTGGGEGERWHLIYILDLTNPDWLCVCVGDILRSRQNEV